jgi:hypothetical protein
MLSTRAASGHLSSVAAFRGPWPRSSLRKPRVLANRSPQQITCHGLIDLPPTYGFVAFTGAASYFLVQWQAVQVDMQLFINRTYLISLRCILLMHIHGKQFIHTLSISSTHSVAHRTSCCNDTSLWLLTISFWHLRLDFTYVRSLTIDRSRLHGESMTWNIRRSFRLHRKSLSMPLLFMFATKPVLGGCVRLCCFLFNTVS